MIIKDFRYIIKRILIGLGIIVGLSFIKSCNVYALEDTSNMVKINSINYMYRFDIWYDNSTHSLYGRKKVNGTIKEQTLVVPEGFDYYTAFSGKTPQSNLQMFFSNSPLYASTNTGSFVAYCVNTPCGMYSYGLDIEGSSNKVFTSQYLTPVKISSNYNSFPYTFVNYDFKDKNGNLIQSKNVEIGSVAPPEIVSLNPTLNKNDNVLISVSFNPEFSIFDTNNYNYYAWFKGYNKFKIESENTTPFNTMQNTTFYVEIQDKQGNIVDSETYTVFGIGQYDVSEYEIQFSTESYTESDTTNTDKPVDYIDRVDIDMLFMPKSPYLKYQYQFVNEGDSLTDNWITINPENSSDLSKNDYVFTTHDNGTLYARIVDLTGSYLYSATYTVVSIGDVKYYANDTGVGGFFDKITNKLDYSGPISSLIAVPVRLFSSLATESSKACTPYSFGSLLGSDITFSCVNIENYIGSNLYHLLDLLMSFGLVLGIIHFIKKQYNKFTSLNDKSDDIM